MPSLVLMHNIEAADTGVLLYYYATVVVRNNVFIDSGNGVVSSYLHERALVMGNTFAGADYRILGVNTSGLHVSNNVLTSARGRRDRRPRELPRALVQPALGRGRARRAPPSARTTTSRWPPGFRDVAARDYRLGDEARYGNFGCYQPQDEEGFAPDPGAYGGPLGPWYLQEITIEDVLRVVD